MRRPVAPATATPAVCDFVRGTRGGAAAVVDVADADELMDAELALDPP
jgi:hypothetical protein